MVNQTNRALMPCNSAKLTIARRPRPQAGFIFQSLHGQSAAVPSTSMKSQPCVANLTDALIFTTCEQHPQAHADKLCDARSMP
jgi:hypothetical protein